MDIKTWVDGHPKGQRGKAIERIAKATENTPAAVRHWIAGLRTPRPESAMKIVTLTGGEVTLAEIYSKQDDETKNAA